MEVPLLPEAEPPLVLISACAYARNATLLYCKNTTMYKEGSAFAESGMAVLVQRLTL